MRTSLVRALVAIVFLTVATAACSGPATGNSDANGSAATTPLAKMEVPEDPRELTGAATAVLADRHVEPVDVDEKPVLPAKVVSHERSGTLEVTVPDTSRVVAFDIAGSIASTVWGLGLGDRLVARDITTEIPGSDDLPIITSGTHSLNAEALLALKPTVVITDGTIGPRDVVEQLRDVGIKVVFVENEASFEGAAQLARDVAAIFGLPETGEALAASIETQIKSVTDEVARFIPKDPEKRLRIVFLYLRGNSGIYYLFGESSGADQMITALGGIDVATEMGWAGMRPLTDEALVKAAPDLILTMTDGLASTGGVKGLIDAKPAVALTSAGQNNRIIDMADGDVLTFGPRAAGVLEALARAVYSPGATR